MLLTCEKSESAILSECAKQAREKWELVSQAEAGPCQFRITLIEHDGINYLKESSPTCERGDAFLHLRGRTPCVTGPS